MIPASIRFSNTPVQQPVQQRRRKTAEIGGTQRTPDPGIEHAEDACEHRRTLPSVSRMRYHLACWHRLERKRRNHHASAALLCLWFRFQIDMLSLWHIGRDT
ncbi:MAG: hypothetical protein ACXVCM_12170 [Ktedonobacteraceae bacterium]